MYVDKSENEFSLHQLEHEDLELIYNAVVHYTNELTNKGTKEEKTELKPRLVHFINKIENELHDF